jgi:hypothetical protein
VSITTDTEELVGQATEMMEMAADSKKQYFLDTEELVGQATEMMDGSRQQNINISSY